jgi:hypothetical protein
MTLINADKTNKISVNLRHPRHLRSPKTFLTASYSMIDLLADR